MARWANEDDPGPSRSSLSQSEGSAAERGQSLRDFVAEALQDKLDQPSAREMPSDPKWMRGFGRLKRLHKETARVQSVVDEEFEGIEPEDRR